jgi:hypothetical protein
VYARSYDLPQSDGCLIWIFDDLTSGELKRIPVHALRDTTMRNIDTLARSQLGYPMQAGMLSPDSCDDVHSKVFPVDRRMTQVKSEEILHKRETHFHLTVRHSKTRE